MYRPPRRLTFERRFTMSGNSTSMSPNSSPTPAPELPSPSTPFPSPSSTADSIPPTVPSVSSAPSTAESSSSSPIIISTSSEETHTTSTTTSKSPTTPSTPSTTPPSTTPPTTTTTTPPSTSAPSSSAEPTDNPTTVTLSPTTDANGSTQTIIETRTEAQPTTANSTPASASPTTSSTAAPSLNDGSSGSGGGGLTGAGRTAVAVVVPIVGVALLALIGLWFWRRRKQRKDAEELRRKEVEEYGFNPNNDPTLPAIGMAGGAAGGSDGPIPMREEGSGYRGWGTTTAAGSSGRKASTTLSGGGAGRAYSDGTSPSQGPLSDALSGDPLVGGHSGETETLGAMGPAAGANRGGDINRGPSNASSSYSVANRSDGSGEQAVPGGAYGAAQYYASEGPYADDGRGGPAEASGQPVIRDNLARRATRIENPSHFPTQASAGISQNF